MAQAAFCKGDTGCYFSHHPFVPTPGYFAMGSLDMSSRRMLHVQQAFVCLGGRGFRVGGKYREDRLIWDAIVWTYSSTGAL